MIRWTGGLYAAGTYLDADPAHIALTDSTTMGLGLVYGALRLGPDDEILTTPHDHYATIKSLELRAERRLSHRRNSCARRAEIAPIH